MANHKLMGVDDFKNNLKSYYEESGEINVDERIDSLAKAIVIQNKENNPFIFNNFLKTIEAKNIRFR